ncbi:MAG TPA: hypothetical protein VHQ86_03780 [Candidatus Saccharimonadia bacterium]|jgi:hypothetical protein|nr:hypothetical protein [Candidatus Saccharimonadia bacterium]
MPEHISDPTESAEESNYPATSWLEARADDVKERAESLTPADVHNMLAYADPAVLAAALIGYSAETKALARALADHPGLVRQYAPGLLEEAREAAGRGEASPHAYGSPPEAVMESPLGARIIAERMFQRPRKTTPAETEAAVPRSHWRAMTPSAFREAIDELDAGNLREVETMLLDAPEQILRTMLIDFNETTVKFAQIVAVNAHIMNRRFPQLVVEAKRYLNEVGRSHKERKRSI